MPRMPNVCWWETSIAEASSPHCSGTMELLHAEDRARIRGFVINKFRGDAALLRPGIDMMEQRLGIPCAGIVPFLPDLGLEEEDSVAIEYRRTAAARVWAGSGRRVRASRCAWGIIAVPASPANFTGTSTRSRWKPRPRSLFSKLPRTLTALADVLIIPGSKQTLDDLQWMRDRGFADFLAAYSGMLIGICGGLSRCSARRSEVTLRESGERRCRSKYAGPGLSAGQHGNVWRKNGAPRGGPLSLTERIRLSRVRNPHGRDDICGWRGTVRRDSSRRRNATRSRRRGRLRGPRVGNLYPRPLRRPRFVPPQIPGLCAPQNAELASLVEVTSACRPEREQRMDRYWAVHLRQSLEHACSSFAAGSRVFRDRSSSWRSRTRSDLLWGDPEWLRSSRSAGLAS